MVGEDCTRRGPILKERERERKGRERREGGREGAGLAWQREKVPKRRVV